MKNKVDNDISTEVLEERPIFTNFRVIKNVLLLSFAFLLICTSVDGLQMLQSTLNRDEGIGVVSIAIQFAFGCITAFFLMKYVILKFGTKLTLTCCLLAHIPSIAANFYPHWLIMIPSYAILGVAATLLWGSNSAYLNDISNIYANNFKTTKSESSYQNINELNNKFSTFDIVENLNSFDGCQKTNCAKCSTQIEDSVSPCTNVNCDKTKIKQTSIREDGNDKSVRALNKTNNMLTVLELVNATMEAIGGSNKLDGSSSATSAINTSGNATFNTKPMGKLVNTSVVNPMHKSDFVASTTNPIEELDNASSNTNPMDKLDHSSSAANPTHKLAFVSSTTNPIDEVDNASCTTNPMENFNSSSSLMNPVDKLDSTFSRINYTGDLDNLSLTTNSKDKLNSVFLSTNPIIQTSTAPTAHHKSVQDAFVSLLVESTTARFFGIHSMFYQSGHIWSNIVSFYVLQQGVINNTYIHDSSCMCGADFCNIESECFESNLKEPSKEVKYVLISIFLALNVLAVLLTAIFLDPLENKKSTVHYSLDFALATFNQLKRPLQLLIVPLSIYMGMSQGFFYADYPKAFVGCAWGMHHVALVTIIFGITNSIASTISGFLVKHIGRRAIFLIAAAINVAVNIIMLLWTPNSDRPTMFFVVAGMWGALMGSFWSQLKAFHGVLFKNNEEAAFGCYELSHSIGACISFACSNYICLYIKIYMLLFVSSVGIVGYLVAEQIRPQNK